MPKYHTPGVYFEWEDRRFRGATLARADIAGFVGIARRGPVRRPVRIESWNQFISVFGRHSEAGYLAWAVEGFFANGGKRCWVIRVASERASCAGWSLAGRDNKPVLSLTAATPGSWARDLEIATDWLRSDVFTLTLRLPDGYRETWRNLGIDPAGPRFAGTVLNDGATGSHLAHVCLSASLPEKAALQPGALQPGADGLADLTAKDMEEGLALLAEIDEVAVLAFPDLCAKPQTVFTPVERPACCQSLIPSPPLPAPPTQVEIPPALEEETIIALQQAMVAQCEVLKDRIAVLDFYSAVGSSEAALAWRGRFDSSYAACYYPWLLVPDVLQQEGMVRAVPPSGHVAGIYARVEALVGVHKPPANEVLEGVEDVTVAIDQAVQGLMNDEQLNLIAAYRGRRIRVAGARTGSSDRAWMFVSVRRLFLAIQRSIRIQLQWIAFEPNDAFLWQQVDRVVRSFLDGLWRRGMLDGASKEAAYSVKCDATVNPESESSQGKVICEIGILPPWPAEFVVMRIGMTEGVVEMLAPAEAEVG